MEKPKQPTKEQVHAWMMERAKNRQPLPTMQEIRRQLGFELSKKAPDLPR